MTRSARLPAVVALTIGATMLSHRVISPRSYSLFKEPSLPRLSPRSLRTEQHVRDSRALEQTLDLGWSTDLGVPRVAPEETP